jgi:F0F1-type ATP synthase membrane subunit c/vacuolar-type H+-ATPase subunit K
MAQGLNEQFQGGRELVYLTQKDNYLGSFLSRLGDAVNTLAGNAGVAAVGKTSPPPRVDNITVQGTQVGDTLTAPSEILHWTLTHNQAINKGIKYFSEIDTTDGFTQPHVYEHGTSRSGFLTLPTFSSAGVKATYYLRSYAQYPGSDACAPTVVGNLGAATKIQMTGASITALLPSTGSGTASPQGQQGGQGLGAVIRRPTTQPKRLAKQF